jgi:probable pyridine nucleotide-disulfide oxidoreductase
MPADSVLRGLTLSETRGFLKMLFDEHSNKILGFTTFVTGAGDLMAVVQTGNAEIFTHPTMAEGLPALLADVEVR